MLTKNEYEAGVKYVIEEFEKAGIVITDAEKQKIEVADFGLGMVEKVGLQLLTYVNTDDFLSSSVLSLKPTTSFLTSVSGFCLSLPQPESEKMNIKANITHKSFFNMS